MDTPIAIKEFTRKNTFPCNDYITSVDVINNIVAVTDKTNMIYVFDLYKEKEILKLKIENKNVFPSVAEVKLLKKYKTINESKHTNENENENEIEKKENEIEQNENEIEQNEKEIEQNKKENEYSIEYENGEFEIEEILIIERGEKGKKIYISHCTLNNPKIIHKYIFEYGIIENGFALHPKTHIFIVTLESKELGVYNIIDKTCLYSTTVQNPYCIPCFNKTGIIYACSLEQKSLCLYSSYADEYTEEHFANFDISKILENDNDYCINMDFSYDDKKLVIVTKYHQMYTIDAFDGTILYKYIYEQDATQNLIRPDFIPRPIFSFDSNFVISGEKSSNIICVWDVQGNFICKFGCEDNVAFIKWIYNRNAFIATTTSVMLWQLNEMKKQ